MLNIAWLCYGFVNRNFIAADGGANIRIPIIDRLLDRGDTVWFLGPRRKQTHEAIFFQDLHRELGQAYKKFVKSYTGSTKVRDFLLDFEFNTDNMPVLDVIIVELNSMGLNMPFNAAIVNYYVKFQGTKIIIFDTDNILGGMRGYLKLFDIDIEDLTIIKPHIKNDTKTHYIVYYPYNIAEERLIKKGDGLCYIGNDYKRRDKMRIFYNFEFADVYGKYKDEVWKAKMKCNFKGQIMPSEVHNIYSEYLMCIHIVHKSYEKIGLVPQRINEVLESGTLMYADANIAGIKQFFDPEYLIRSRSQALRAYEKVKAMSEEEYEMRVQCQREKIKEIFTYKKFMHFFEKSRASDLGPKFMEKVDGVL